MPCGTKQPTNRGFPAAAVCASAVAAGIIASRSGRASVAPAPLRTVRRGMCFFVKNIALSTMSVSCPDRMPFNRLHVHLERLALHDRENDRREAVVVAGRLAHDRSDQRHVLILDAPPER